MKVRVNDKITAEVKITQTTVCPERENCGSGTAYYTIDYLINGVCIHSATTGAIYGSPNPIAMLDRFFTVSEYHYQDIASPDPMPTGDEAKNRKLGRGTSGGRPAWWEEKGKTHRQAIIEAVAQIVKE